METRLRVSTVAFEWRSFREAIAWLDMGVMAVYKRVIKTSPFGGVGATVAVMVVRGSMGERGGRDREVGDFRNDFAGRHGGCDGGGEEKGGERRAVQTRSRATCSLSCPFSFLFCVLCCGIR